MDADLMHCNGWTFSPAREEWYAQTGPVTWTVVKGALDDPPTWAPET